jgi:hypothetical protein
MRTAKPISGPRAGQWDASASAAPDLAEESPMALLPAAHALADRPVVTAAELRRDPAYRAQAPAVSMDALVDMVALGRLVLVVGHGGAERLGSAVVAVPVADLPSTAIVLAWPRRTARKAALSAFLRGAREVVAARDDRARAALVPR